MASRAQKKQRASRRNAQRTQANAAARAVPISHDPATDRTRVRHQDMLEYLSTRQPPSITPAQLRAGRRFQSAWAARGDVAIVDYDRLGDNFGSGSPTNSGPAEDRLRAAGEVSQALIILGPLAPILLHVAIENRPPAAWSIARGNPRPDGLGLLRAALDTLDDHYRGASRARRHRQQELSAPCP